MATQTRVPGAASSEVDFELERFERTREDRIEISGRWYGLRGRRFVRPVLNVNLDGGTRRRAIALLEHKPWAADDGKTWVAAFAWPKGIDGIEGAVLEVGPGLIVDLPAPGGKPGSQGRVSALRPHSPTQPALKTTGDDGEDPAAGHDPGARRGGPSARAREERSGGPSARARAAGGHAERAHEEGAPPPLTEREERAARRARRGPARDWSQPPELFEGGPARTGSPPRDVITAAIAERDEAITARDDAERERLRALNDRDDALSRRDAALRDVERAQTERDEAVAERERLQSELDRVTRERDVAHAERNRTLRASEAVERERDQAAAERDAARNELSRALPARDEALRLAEAETARAEQAESERDTAYAERKSAVAQRDRARRERDRAMRAAGVEPPTESPHVGPAPLRRPVAAASPAEAAAPAAGQDAHAPAESDAPAASHDATVPAEFGAPATGRDATAPDDSASEADPTVALAAGARAGSSEGGVPPTAAARVPGEGIPSRPLKRLGQSAAGPAPEPKPLLTPVDSGRPRRLSRTRRAPSAPARWAVRILVLVTLVAIAIVLAILLASVV